MPSAPASPNLRTPSSNPVHRADFARYDSAPSLRTAPTQFLPRHHAASPLLPRQFSNSYLFDAHSSSASSPSIAPNSSSGFQHQQHQNQHSSSAHYQHHQQHQHHHLDNNHSNDTITTSNNNNSNSNNSSTNNHLNRIAPLHLYQSQQSQSQSQTLQQPSSTYQPHTTAGNDIPPAPYTFPPSATLLSSLHSGQTTDPSPSHSSSYLHYNPYSNGSSGYNAQSGYLTQGQSQAQAQGHAQVSPYVTPSGSRQTSFTGLKASPGTGMGAAGGTGGSKSDYVAAYELSVANAVAGNLRGGDTGQYAASPLSLDHLSFRNYSRPTSPPHRHLSLSVDPRSAPHTVMNTPDISPDRSAASTPGLSSLHGGSTRKTKYTRSRTGCLGCRVKRVKCDEGRPECKRCVTAKRSCTYPAVQDLPKATIRALAAKKRQDSGDSTGDDEVHSERKRARVSGSAGEETSVDHYMNLIDEEGNVKRRDHTHAGMGQYGKSDGAHRSSYPYNNGNGSGQNGASQSAAASWVGAQTNNGYGSQQNDYGRPAPVSTPSYPLSAQGYSSSISSYHLHATPAYYAGQNQNQNQNQFKQQQSSSTHDQRMNAQLPYPYQQPYSNHNGASVLDHHLKRGDYGNGHTSTANTTAISSPDDGVGLVDNGLIAQHHRTSDPQYLSDISRLTSPTLSRSTLVGGNAYQMKEEL